MILKHLQIIFLLSLATTAIAETTFGGHVKYFYSYSDFPDDSVYAENANPYRESLGNLRLKAESHSGNWDARLHYELNGLYSTELSNCIFRSGLAGRSCAGLVSDQNQLFDLSSIISESDNSVLFQRIDRLVLAYSTEKLVTRVGRQAISWGNGMVYNPLDLFNPFPPDAIDTEYKRGEDMLYMQGLFGNGSDLQGLVIPRRNPVSGEVESSQSAIAGKYHWLASNYELDLLAARNYGDTVVGAAYTGEWHENIINASATLTHAGDENYLSVSASYNYSSILYSKNLTGFVELFYNGFGLSGKRHSIEDVIGQQALFSRLLRGELFTIGKYYLATGTLLELTPLLNLNPILFLNLGDRSAMLQFIGTYSLTQNFDLLAGFNLPMGADGTEFGGIEATSDSEQYLSPANTLFARLAWYF
ncbi:MAG: hypothetical protein ACN4GR_02305 [Arenicellales bacterium]